MNNPGRNPEHRPVEQSAFDVDEADDARISPNRRPNLMEGQMQAAAPKNFRMQDQRENDRESWNLVGKYSNEGQDNDIS